jgi:hypothetical protein
MYEMHPALSLKTGCDMNPWDRLYSQVLVDLPGISLVVHVTSCRLYILQPAGHGTRPWDRDRAYLVQLQPAGHGTRPWDRDRAYLVQLLTSFSKNLVVERIWVRKDSEYCGDYVQRKMKWS